jgi:hypothetical protein
MDVKRPYRVILNVPYLNAKRSLKYMEVCCAFISEWQQEVFADDNYDVLVNQLADIIQKRKGEDCELELGEPVEIAEDAADDVETEIDATSLFCPPIPDYLKK